MNIKTKRKISLGLIVLLVGLYLFIRFNGMQNRYYFEMVNKIYPTAEDAEGFSIVNGRQIYDENGDELKGGLYYSIAPGDGETGYVAIKNSMKEEQTFFVEFLDFSFEGSEDGTEASAISVEYSKDPFVIGPNDFILYDFHINVLENAIEGSYSGKINVIKHSDSMSEIAGDNIDVRLAYGRSIFLDVSNSPLSYEYAELLSSPGEISRSLFINEVRRTFSYGLLIIALYILLLGFVRKNR